MEIKEIAGKLKEACKDIEKYDLGMNRTYNFSLTGDEAQALIDYIEGKEREKHGCATCMFENAPKNSETCKDCVYYRHLNWQPKTEKP